MPHDTQEIRFAIRAPDTETFSRALAMLQERAGVRVRVVNERRLVISAEGLDEATLDALRAICTTASPELRYTPE